MSKLPSNDPPSRALRVPGSDALVPQRTIGRPQAPKVNDPLTLSFVVRALQQWWKLVLPLALLLSAVGGGLAWMSFKPSYRATAILQIKEQGDYVAFQTNRDSQRFTQTQIEILRGPLVLEPLLSNPKIAKLPEVVEQPDPLEWLKKGLMIKNINGSELFEVSFAGPNAANVALIVNEIISNYLEETDSVGNDQRKRIIELLNEQKKEWEKKVTFGKEKVLSLAKDIPGSEVVIGGRHREDASADTPLSALQAMLIKAEFDQEVMKVEKTALEDILAAQKWELPADVLEEHVETHPQIVEFKNALEAERLKLVEQEKALGGVQGRAYLETVKTRLAGEEKKLENLRAQLRERLPQELANNDKREKANLLREKQLQLDNMAIVMEKLNARAKELQAGQSENRGDVVKLDFAKAELERDEGVYERICDRVLALQTESKAPARVFKYRDAPVPQTPEEKSPLKVAGIVAAAGFCLPFVLAIAWERRVKRILDTQQILEESYLPVVGEVAALPIRRMLGRRGGARNLSRARYVFEESIDSLRTTLVLSEDLRDMQIIAVVSSVSREGKTSLSAQLAVSLARATGTPVLLVDSDIRSPDLHQIFDVPLEPGLVKVLGGVCSPRDAIQRGGSNQLVHVLPAGRLQKNPHSLMGHGALKALLEQFRPDYRYIVVDTPPVLSASESLVVAKAADGALLCTLRETSRAPQVKLTYERLLSAGTNVIGVVLSGVPTSHYAHKYGSYAYAHL